MTIEMNVVAQLIVERVWQLRRRLRERDTTLSTVCLSVVSIQHCNAFSSYWVDGV